MMRSAATPSPGLPLVRAVSRARYSAWLGPATANRAPAFSTIGATSGPDTTSASSPPASNAPMSGTSGVTWPAPGVETTRTFMVAATYFDDDDPGRHENGKRVVVNHKLVTGCGRQDLNLHVLSDTGTETRARNVRRGVATWN